MSAAFPATDLELTDASYQPEGNSSNLEILHYSLKVQDWKCLRNVVKKVHVLFEEQLKKILVLYRSKNTDEKNSCSIYQ